MSNGMRDRNWESLEKKARELMETLLSNGYEIYWVGGCVRDRVMNRPVKDMDFATDAKPEVVAGLFARTLPTGLKHGTVTVLLDGTSFEVTTFRKESDYQDKRHPSHVEFISDLRTDLSRRDFTMNAMAMDIEGRLIDPFGGRADLGRGIIRCVGEPSLRFQEDALRMLRCVRFAAEYGLDVEDATWSSLLRQAADLKIVAMERVHGELDRIVNGTDPLRGLSLLIDSQLLMHLKLTLAWPQAAWRRAVQSPGAAGLGKLPRGNLRWACLVLLLNSDIEALRQSLAHLKFSNDHSRCLLKITGFHHWLTAWRPDAEDVERRSAWRFREGVIRFGPDTARGWLKVTGVMGEVDGTLPDDACPGAEASRTAARFLALCRTEGPCWLETMPAAGLGDLAVDGKALLDRGWKPGPLLGECLHHLLGLTAHGQLPNECGPLLEEAAAFKKMRGDES